MLGVQGLLVRARCRHVDQRDQSYASCRGQLRNMRIPADDDERHRGGTRQGRVGVEQSDSCYRQFNPACGDERSDEPREGGFATMMSAR